MRPVTALAMIACLVVYAAGAQAKEKVVEKSARRVPVWVGTSQAGYIVASTEAPDIEAAKALCMDNVRRQVAEAVAQNVSSSSVSQIDQKSVGNQVTGFLDSYSSTFKTQAAPMPYLQGISPSKVEASYWEKRLDKESGKITVMYAVKYPFPAVDLKELAWRFEKHDREMWGKYQALAEDMGKVESLEQIDRAIDDLGPVISYLFDEGRKNAAQSLQQSYRKLYSSIAFRTISDEPGEYRFCMTLDGRPLKTSQRMTLQSDCATRLTAQTQPDGAIAVKYNYDNCRRDRQSEVAVKMRINNRIVTQPFFVNTGRRAIELWPENTVYLNATGRADSVTLTAIDVRIFFKAGFAGPFTIKTMTLEAPGLSDPLFMDMLNYSCKTQESTVNVTWVGSVKVLEEQYNQMNMLRGSVEVEVPGEAQPKRINFVLPVKTNW